jgi:hypothetical protein
LPFVNSLQAAGVDEVACLIDFLQDVDQVMESLPYIKQLKDACEANPTSNTLAPLEA